MLQCKKETPPKSRNAVCYMDHLGNIITHVFMSHEKGEDMAYDFYNEIRIDKTVKAAVLIVAHAKLNCFDPPLGSSLFSVDCHERWREFLGD